MIHIIHTWVHSTLRNSFKCLGCNAEITDYQFILYPHEELLKSDYPYWYDPILDEIWHRLKTVGYMNQKLDNPYPEDIKAYEWKVSYIWEDHVDWDCDHPVHVDD